MDRSWIDHTNIKDRRTPKYQEGVTEFLNFAFAKVGTSGKIRCPCYNCLNGIFLDRDTIFNHLVIHGILRDYKNWTLHGEESIDDLSDEEYDEVQNNGDDIGYDEIGPLIHDVTNVRNVGFIENADPPVSDMRESDEVPDYFARLMKDAEQELFPGHTSFSKLEFILHLLHLKVLHRWSDKSFTMLLRLLNKVFFHDIDFPKSSYEAKKYTRLLGLNYVKIDACKNDCILYRKEYADCTSCPTCGLSRWKIGDNEGSSRDRNDYRRNERKIPQKILRHFPLIPRLKRLFMSSKIASHMRWHKKNCCDDGILRHPADSEAWKSLDKLYPQFALDSRNARLGLAADGFNPFGNLSTSYSIWPVILVPYNLPPWMCMKEDYFMLSLLIPGKKSPGNSIDVYLEPLIEELQQLWEVGVDTYDAYSSQNFKMHAALLWTINDFPAYANLSGWSTKGALACPSCNLETCHLRLENGHKFCYMGHRRFLEVDHKWRFDKKSFDGTVETRSAPKHLSGEDVLEQLCGSGDVIFGNFSEKRKRNETCLRYNWKKKSIFFRLPYWSNLLIRHNLDVMHIEKNICDNILGTLMNIVGKTKDGLNARLDLEVMHIRKELHPVKVGDKYSIPAAAYTLSLNERREVCNFLSNLKFPDGYSSNIARCVNAVDGKISGMKSHDSHIFMQDLLAPTFRGVLPKEVYEPLVELGLFFKHLCGKSLKLEVLERLEYNIARTLCKLECVFPPSFFDIMEHLPMHLATEAKIAGPVQYRWMFPFERSMLKLKSLVRNQAHPEGSIAEGYIADECLNFCSRYLNRTETRFNRKERNYDGSHNQRLGFSVFSKIGKPLSKGTSQEISFHDYRRAQLYVLKNCPEVQPFLGEFENLDGMQSVDFVDWFHGRITHIWNEGDREVSKDLLYLAQGPTKRVVTYDAYLVNGYRFHTKYRAKKRKTQNSGVVVKGDVQSGERDFFGLLKEIVELEYNGDNKVVLFKCDWYDVYNEGKGMKKDSNGVISVNTTCFLQTDEPYILACQGAQVYYVVDRLNANWQVVVKTIPRNFYDSPRGEDNDDDDEPFLFMEEPSSTVGLEYVAETNDSKVFLLRRDLSPERVNIHVGSYEKTRKNNKDGNDFITDDIIEESASMSETEFG